MGFRPVVLDQGCGEALSADEIAARCERLYLCDAAASVRARLKAHFAGASNIVVINPVEVADIPESSVDLVVANSLVQYLARPGVRIPAAALASGVEAARPPSSR